MTEPLATLLTTRSYPVLTGGSFQTINVPDVAAAFVSLGALSIEVVGIMVNVNVLNTRDLVLVRGHDAADAAAELAAGRFLLAAAGFTATINTYWWSLGWQGTPNDQLWVRSIGPAQTNGISSQFLFANPGVF